MLNIFSSFSISNINHILLVNPISFLPRPPNSIELQQRTSAHCLGEPTSPPDRSSLDLSIQRKRPAAICRAATRGCLKHPVGKKLLESEPSLLSILNYVTFNGFRLMSLMHAHARAPVRARFELVGRACRRCSFFLYRRCSPPHFLRRFHAAASESGFSFEETKRNNLGTLCLYTGRGEDRKRAGTRR